MYSLAGKVLEVENETTVVVELRDKSKRKAKVEKSANVKAGDFISIVGHVENATVQFEMCGDKKLKKDFIWD